MLVSEVFATVQREVGDQAGIYLKDTYVLDWVNQAIRDIYRKTNLGRDAPTTVALSAGTNTWDPGNNRLYKVHYIYIQNYWELEEKDFDEILNLYGTYWHTEQATPKYFWRGFDSGKNILRFAPTPEKAYTLNISTSSLPTPFTQQTDDLDTVLPLSYIDDVVRFCVMRSRSRENDPASASLAMSEYQSNLNERVAESQKIDDSFAIITPDEYDLL